MNLKCIIGIHEWHGCKCQTCGKTRDQEHDWSKDCEKCDRCGYTRSSAHQWHGCKCQTCGKTRDQEHDWSKDCEKCDRCGYTRYSAHQWNGCKCLTCGKIHDQDHDWGEGSDKCARCGKLNPSIFAKSNFTIYVPGLNPTNPFSVLSVLSGLHGKPILYNAKEVGRVSVVDVKTDGRVIIIADLKPAYSTKTLGSDLVLRD